MFRLRGCPRCNGDLREGKDKYGKYLTCLQCGYHESETKDSGPPILPTVSKRGRPRKSVASTPLT
jgi:hypothetical protein